MNHKHDLTGKVIGLAINVHKTLGSAYEEKIYQKALAIELKESNIKFDREKEVKIKYKGEYIGKKRLDFVIENELIVELKKTDSIKNVHIAQVVSYLKTLDFNLGLILNFGGSKIEIKRVIA